MQDGRSNDDRRNQERHEKNGAGSPHGWARSAPAITTTSASPAALSV